MRTCRYSHSGDEGAGPTRLSWECASGRAACGPARVFGPLSGVAAPGRGSAASGVGQIRRVLGEGAALLSEVGQGVAKDLLEGHPLRLQLVHPAPDGGATEGPRPDVVGEPADEVELRGEHPPPVLALDEE